MNPKNLNGIKIKSNDSKFSFLNQSGNSSISIGIDQTIQTRPPLKDISHQNTLIKENIIKNFGKSQKKIINPLKRIGNPENPQECVDYEIEIYQLYKENENKYLLNNNLLKNQTNITNRMRSTVIDWLVEVHRKLKLNTDTLFYSVYYIDKYLSNKDLDKSKFQLLACAAILVASKNEEIYPPQISDLVHFSCDSFTSIALNRMESSLVTTLDYQLHPILPSQFLRRFLKIAECNSKETILSHFINESILLDFNLIGEKPSLIAASVLCISLTLLNGTGTWNKEIESQIEYSTNELKVTINHILNFLNNNNLNSKNQAIKKKYSSDLMYNISNINFPNHLKL